MQNHNRYYVYALLDSSKFGEYVYGDYCFLYEPFYIGKGTKERYKNSIKSANNSGFKKSKIKSLMNKGIKIISDIIIPNLTHDESIEKEIELISLIGRRDLKTGVLVNMTDGGDGRLSSKPSPESIAKANYTKSLKPPLNYRHSEETLKIMSKKQTGKGNGFYGKTHKVGARENISIKNTGENHPMYNKKHTVETIEKLREASKKVDRAKLALLSQKNNKEVLMYDLEMNFLKEFESVKAAATFTSIEDSIISKSCRGEILAPTRYFFRYKNKEDKIKNNKFLLDVDNNFYYQSKKHKLLKKNSSSVIAVDLENNENVSIRDKDFKAILLKDSNDSLFAEFTLFIRNIDSTFKVNKITKTLENKNIIIYYNKLMNNSEILVSKKDMMNRLNSDKRVLNVFEDTWENSKEILKSRIRSILGVSVRKIYARKCEVKEVVDNGLIRTFLNENHAQKYIKSNVKIGLFYEGELVSLMVLGSLRVNLGQTAQDGYYEMLRFCNLLNCNIVGGASKIFTYFLKKYSPINIMSYADRNMSIGNLYEKLNFKFVKNTEPNYYYIVDDVRKNRFGYRKDLLVSQGFDVNKTEIEIQHSRGYYRIFDFGNLKYEYIRND